MHAVKGLFVESSATSPFLLGLEKLLDPDALAWGVHYPGAKGLPDGLRRALIAGHLRTAGVDGIVSAKRLPEVDAQSQHELLESTIPIEVRTFGIHGKEYKIRDWKEKTYVPRRVRKSSS